MTEDLNTNATEGVKESEQTAETHAKEREPVESSQTISEQSEPSAVPPLVIVEKAAVLEDDGRTPIVTEKSNQKEKKEKK